MTESDLITASAKLLPLPRLSEPQTILHLAHFADGDADRAPLEDFIRTVFARSYGARITSFYPCLISLRRPDDSFAAVAGVRPAAQHNLFAEQYLDVPIEAAIAACSDVPVTRAQVVEVGNLAPADAGQARWLIATITAYLYAGGFRWVVFTAVPALHNAFVRMGLRPLPLAPAQSDRLDRDALDDWGTYYRQQPRVYAGDIVEGWRNLQPLIDADLPRLQALWQAAQALGSEHAMDQVTDSLPRCGRASA